MKAARTTLCLLAAMITLALAGHPHADRHEYVNIDKKSRYNCVVSLSAPFHTLSKLTLHTERLLVPPL